MTLQANVMLRVTGNFKNADNNAAQNLARTMAQQFTDGTGANQANVAFIDVGRAIGGSSTDQLDLSGGITDAYGNTITMTGLKAIIIDADGANPSTIEIEEPSSNGIGLFGAAGDNVSVEPGGRFYMSFPSAGGLPITGGSADLLDIVNGDAAGANYSIILIGIE